MDNQSPSRESLKNSNLSPVDPAFRPATTSDNLSIPPPPSNLPGSSSSVSSDQLNQPEASLPSDLPTANPLTDQPTSSDVKSTGINSDQPANGLLNLKEFPELKNPQENNSETKKVLIVGGVITTIIFLTAGVLFLLTKNKTDKSTDTEQVSNDTTISEETTIPKTFSDSTEPKKIGGETTLEEDETNFTGEGTSGEETVTSKENTTTQKHITLQEDANLLEVLEGHFSEITKEDTQKEVQIHFYDDAGEKLDLEELIEELKLMVPDYVAEILTTNYYYFLAQTPSSEIPKVSLVLESKFSEHQKTEEVLRRWEAYLVRDLKNFVFLGEDADFFKNFVNESELYSLEFYSSGKYPGGRYQNFLKDGSISLNYIVMRDKIIITNSFEALEKTIEHIKSDEDL